MPVQAISHCLRLYLRLFNKSIVRHHVSNSLRICLAYFSQPEGLMEEPDASQLDIAIAVLVWGSRSGAYPEDSLDVWVASRLLAGLGQVIGQQVAVLNGHAATLAQVGLHRMCTVSQQRHMALCPAALTHARGSALLK